MTCAEASALSARMAAMTDEELAAAGKMTRAQQAMVEDHGGLAGAVANRYGTADRRRPPSYHEMEEIRAEAMLGLCAGAAAFDPGRGVKFSTVGYTYARNQVLRHLADGQLKGRRILDYAARWGGADLAEIAEQPPVDDEPGELRALLEEYIERLPRRLATVLRLRLDRLTLKQVGATIGVSRERVRQLQDQAHRALRAMAIREGADLP